MWNPDSYLKKLTSDIQPRLKFHQSSDWRQWKEELVKRFTSLLGGFPEQPAALEAVVLERVRFDDYIQERVEITTYEGLRMPLYVLIPRQDQQKFPSVIALHGHGYGSREIVGLEPDGSIRSGDPGLHKDFAVELVKRGFIVAAPELIGFGDRRFEVDKEAAPGKSSCFHIAAQLLLAGQTVAGYRVYETMRVVDYLQTRGEVQHQQIGCMGISGGGLVAAFTAALDERIQATAVSGYANTFADSIVKVGHCLDNYIPGLLLEAEMSDIIGLIAPRSLLIESGDQDRVFPVAGARKAVEALERIYDSVGASDRLETDFFHGGHEISGAKAYDWFELLKNE